MGQDIIFERGEVVGIIHKLEDVDDAVDACAVQYDPNS